MNTLDSDRQKMGFWSQIKIRLEPVGVVVIISGVLVLIAALVTRITIDSQTNLLEIALVLFSLGLGLIALGISAKSDRRYTEILSSMAANLTRVLSYYEPSEDKLEFPPDLSKNVVIEPPPATASAEVVAPKVETLTPEASRAKAQARLDADTKKVGYVRGELFQKEDRTWAIHWGGKYPL